MTGRRTSAGRSGFLHLRTADVERARWKAALAEGETLSDYLRAGAEALALSRAGSPPAPDIEQAVEIVVRYLLEHYQSATDDSCPGGAR